jgi:polyphosphate kinase 2 (PPK2 family)
MKKENRLRSLATLYRVDHDKQFHLRNFDPGDTAGISDEFKGEAEQLLQHSTQQLAELQDMLFAQDRWALLLIFQAMDAAGKDGTIKHVMSGVNPQGCEVFSFKSPSVEELDHGYLWRTSRCMPSRGKIGIFNRSYYEEVLVVRVHPELLEAQRLPAACVSGKIWKERFEDISAYERSFWKDYHRNYEDMIRHTSSKHAPWIVVPADHKWFARLVVSTVIVHALEEMKLSYPEVSDEKRRSLAAARRELEGKARAKKA